MQFEIKLQASKKYSTNTNLIYNLNYWYQESGNVHYCSSRKASILPFPADISFCEKCADDAYKRGDIFASGGCWNCACLDGSRQCGCQPYCPEVPAQPIFGLLR